MKYGYVFIIAFSFFTTKAHAQNSSASKLRELDWLLGTWQMEKKGGILTENWQQINDSTFDESSYMQKAQGEKKLLEKVQIVFRDNELFYIPVVSDQNNQQPVTFKITESSQQKFVAENPMHDFPKRIIYEKISPDSIHALIDGWPQMPGKKSDFYYSRQKN